MEYENLLKEIIRTKKVSRNQLERILENNNAGENKLLYESARAIADKVYGKRIFIRGLIEFTNYCKNDCYYCGIRKSNVNADRYRLSKEDILRCCSFGYEAGFRTFVLQGGEDAYYTNDYICEIISTIKNKYPDCALTLSIGEKERSEYQAFFDAGADRYLLRQETSNEGHYQKLHPTNMSLKHRKQCLYDLKEIGYQVGCGFMVGSPYQTLDNIYEDIIFMQEFAPHMIGIGPFIANSFTPFAKERNGEGDTTVKLLSVIRILMPNVLLPATTALGTIEKDGRKKGILAGANVVMPNLSPVSARKKYMLYNNKVCTEAEAGEGLELLKKQMSEIGYEVVVDRGDYFKPK